MVDLEDTTPSDVELPQPSSSKKKSSTPKQKEPTMNVVSFCATKKYNKGIQARLTIFLRKAGDPDAEKTFADWEKVYEQAMNRVTN